MGRNTQGFEKLERRLAQIPKKIRSETNKALMKSAEETAEVQRMLAPVSADGSHGNPPGALRDSVVVTPPGGTTPPYGSGGTRTVPEGAAAVTAGNSGVRYAHLVERGTSKAAAQPFFWPGFRMRRARSLGRIKRALNKAIKESKNG
jgi:HK97 gp10 family phage protein